MIEQKVSAAAATSSLVFWGLTLADVNAIIQLIVGILTAISIGVLIAVNLKKLFEK